MPGQRETQLKPQKPGLQLLVKVRHERPLCWHAVPQMTELVSDQSGAQSEHVPFQQVPRPLHTAPPEVGQLTLQPGER